MKTVILADRLGRELAPLTRDTSVALLSVAGKTVLEHTLDDLSRAGIRQAVLVLASQAERVRALVGDGRRWGIELTYAPSRGEETPQNLFQRLPPLQGQGDATLWIRGDWLRGASLTAFLEAAGKRREPLLHGTLEGRLAGIALVQQTTDLASLVLPPLETDPSALPAGTRLPFDPGSVHAMATLAEFHQASLEAAAGELPALRLPGKATALGLVQGRQSRVAPQSLRVGAAFVGAASRVDPSAELYGRIAIADQVIVDRQARLTDTVVMPQTYIGELVDLRHAIVSGNDLIRIDRGVVMRISDSFLLADLREITLGSSLGTLLHRVTGALLLLLSLPLWPIAYALSRRRSPDRPLLTRSLRGNRIAIGDFGQRERREFTSLEWATEVPLLRYLPRLLAVVTGDIRLVGVEPVTPEQAAERQAEWEKLADSAPAGLIGPTPLRLAATAPAEERLMSDAFYAAHRRAGNDALILIEGLRALFSRRAWRPEG